MSDINLLNKPGIQDNTVDSKYSNVKEEKSLNDNKDNQPSANISTIVTTKKINYFLYALIIFFMIGMGFFSYYYIYNNNPLRVNKQSFTISDIFNILKENKTSLEVNSINFNNNNFFMEIDCINDKSFYNIFDSFSNIIRDQIKGYHIENNYVLNINLPWNIKRNKNFNISLLNKELIDLDMDLKREIYKNKLIIVSNIDNMLKFINLMAELNLINKFNIKIKEIQSLPNSIKLYQIIVE